MQNLEGFGIGRGAYSLLINETTSITVGRSIELSCTQRSQMLTNGTLVPLTKKLKNIYYFRFKKKIKYILIKKIKGS
jgi:hypothetical protein